MLLGAVPYEDTRNNQSTTLNIDLMYDYASNTGALKPLSKHLEAYLLDNMQYINTQVSLFPQDSYWHHVNLMYTQLEGLVDGHSKVADASKMLDYTQIYMVNIMGGDIFDLAGYPYTSTADLEASELKHLTVFFSIIYYRNYIL